MDSGLTKRIVPCLDVAEGRVVKGTQFVDLQELGDPAELACRYEQEGADELVFLDITASIEHRKAILSTVSAVADRLSIPFTLGGGVRTLDDAWSFLDAGADKVALNTAAIDQPRLVETLANRFGRQAIVVAVDCKKEGQGWRVYAYGGRQPTDLDVMSWLKQVEALGAGEILLTSIDRDGTGSGYDLELLRKASALSVSVVASGGASKPEHFLEAFTAGADAALAAGVFHRRELRIEEVKTYLAQHQLPVRPTAKATGENLPC